MVRKLFGRSILIATLALAACGGGGSAGGAGGGAYGGPPATTPPQSNAPIQQAVAGKPGFVNAATHRTLYFLSVDTPTGSACTGGCLSTWLPNTPSAGAQSQGSLTIITRSDGTGMQWAYKSHPLYMYAGDNGPDQANGEGIPFDGGHWHVARPTP